MYLTHQVILQSLDHLTTLVTLLLLAVVLGEMVMPLYLITKLMLDIQEEEVVREELLRETQHLILGITL
jgi:hypothetical protein